MASVYEKRSTWSCLATLAAISLVFCSGCSQAPTTKRHDFPTYSITVPLTWTRTDYGPDSPHKGPYGFIWSGVRFEGPEGEYVDISPDLPTDLQGADTWLSAKVGSAGEVSTVGADKLCEPSPQKPGPEQADPPYVPGCTRGDGRLDVWLSFVGQGHGYVITMGNDKRERAEDLPTVRKVVETMKLK